MNNTHLHFIQALFVIVIAFGTGILNLEDKLQWLNVCRYIIYILTLHGISKANYLVHVYLTSGIKDIQVPRSYISLYAVCVSLLVHFEQSLYRVDFVYLFLAHFVVQWPEMSTKSITYGTGMACSYFEGYLVHLLPSDGANFVGFEDNIRDLEDQEGVLFPVKKLFIVITKSLYCPPDLKEFNKGTDVPYMEAFHLLKDVTKSVAGVKNRRYHNTAYKIYRPTPPATSAEGAGGLAEAAGGPGGSGGPGGPVGDTVAPPPPVCLAAECATPLHTLHKVVNNRTVYQQLSDVDIKSVVEDFCTTLRTIMDRSPHCKGKCELVYYDDEDPNQNLAQILLDKIKELEPKFEEKIIQRRNDNVIEE